jgi:hypothetical protein
MSAEAYKRALFRSWCEAVTVAPFVPTINVNDRPLVTSDVWFTAEWQPDQVVPLAYCGVIEETGLIGLVVAGEPNAGDQAVAGASDAIVAELMARIDPQGMLTLERAGATSEHSAGTADRWYRLFTPLEYRFITGGP